MLAYYFFYNLIYTLESKIEIMKSEASLKNKGNKKTSSEQRRFPVCGDEWIRTTDSRIFSPMLYQLSYITSLSGTKLYKFIIGAKDFGNKGNKNIF